MSDQSKLSQIWESFRECLTAEERDLIIHVLKGRGAMNAEIERIFPGLLPVESQSPEN